jgi:hypothetical protein
VRLISSVLLRGTIRGVTDEGQNSNERRSDLPTDKAVGVAQFGSVG